VEQLAGRFANKAFQLALIEPLRFERRRALNNRDDSPGLALRLYAKMRRLSSCGSTERILGSADEKSLVANCFATRL